MADWSHDLYLYETTSGLFDLQFHWEYTTRMHATIESVLAEFAAEFNTSHQLTQRGLELTLNAPTEVTWDEVQNKQNNRPRRRIPDDLSLS